MSALFRWPRCGRPFRSCLGATVVLLLGLGASRLCAQTWEPGSNHFGPTGRTWIEYRVGDLPIILSAPHGGEDRPSNSILPDRTGNVTTVRDSNTTELADEIAAEIFRRSGRRAHQVMSHLHRIKLDPNREIGEAALGNANAEAAWHYYHDSLEVARQEVIKAHGRGFLIDIHGHGHAIQRLELGYDLTTSEINLTDAQLDTPYRLTRSSVRTLASATPTLLSQLLRGPNAFGTMLMDAGYDSVPSAQIPRPNGDDYFSGGYITETHTSRADAGPICGFQLECHSTGVRNTSTNRRNFAIAFVDVLHDFLRIHYQYDLGCRPQVRLEVIPERVAEGTPAKIRLHRQGDRRASMTVQPVLSGTATAGADFFSPAASVILPAGANFVDVNLATIADGLAEGTETLVFGLALPAGAEMVGEAEVTVLLEDLQTVQVWVEAVEPVVAPGGTARFQLRRTASTGSLTVGLAAAGTARAGWDYPSDWPPATVTWAAGQTLVELAAPLVADGRRRPDRSLSLTVGGGPNHRVGVPGAATVTVVDPVGTEAGPVLHLGGAADADAAADLAVPGRRLGLQPNGAMGPVPGGTVARPHWSFDGQKDQPNDIANDAIFVPPMAAAPEGAFSISLRFRTPTLSGNGSRSLLAFGAIDQPESVHILMVESNRQLRTAFRDSNDSTSATALDAGTGFANNAWHHYALVVQPGQPARVFVNGVERNTSSRGGDPMPTPQVMWLGWRDGSTTNRHWMGQLADVRWYHRALAVDEVAALAADRPDWALWARARQLDPVSQVAMRDSLGQPLYAHYALGGLPDRPGRLPSAEILTNGDRVFRWAERANVPGLVVTPERLQAGGFGPVGSSLTETVETFETVDEVWRERTLRAPAGTGAEVIRLRVQ